MEIDLNEVRDHIECSVWFDRTARTMPAATASRCGGMQCPLCRQTFEVPVGCSTLLNNVYAMTLVDAVNALREERDQLEASAKSAAELIRQLVEQLRTVDEQLAVLTTKYEESEQQLLTSKVDTRNFETACRMQHQHDSDVEILRRTRLCQESVDRLIEVPDSVNTQFRAGDDPSMPFGRPTDENGGNCFSSGVVAVARRQRDVDRKPFDPKCGLVVHGLMPESDVEDVDVFQALCSKYFDFIPCVRPKDCHRFTNCRSPLLIVCQDKADALRVLNLANRRAFRHASGVSVVRYKPELTRKKTRLSKKTRLQSG